MSNLRYIFFYVCMLYCSKYTLFFSCGTSIHSSPSVWMLRFSACLFKPPPPSPKRPSPCSDRSAVAGLRKHHPLCFCIGSVGVFATMAMWPRFSVDCGVFFSFLNSVCTESICDREDMEISTVWDLSGNSPHEALNNCSQVQMCVFVRAD